MSRHKNKLNWCLKNGKRMKRIAPNSRLSEEHIEKAKHNLKAADFNIQGGFSDWAIIMQCIILYWLFCLKKDLNQKIMNAQLMQLNI